MKSYQKRSKVLSIANALKKEGWAFSEAQKRAWQIVRCICEMKKNEVVLRYFKEGDEIPQQRAATLAPAYINYIPSTTAKARKENPLQVKYYDLGANGFRSFNAARFDSFKTVIQF